ncbi:hypothetical protein PEKONANI_02385 [Aeromonas jandaei]
MIRVVPAYQCLKTVESTIRHRDLGLQERHQLSLIQRMADILAGEGELHPFVVFPMDPRIAVLQHVAQILGSERFGQYADHLQRAGIGDGVDHIQYIPIHGAHHGDKHLIAGVLLQLADEFNPIHSRHVEIGQQQIDMLQLLQLVEGILTIAGQMDLAKAQILQQTGHLILLGTGVIDHQGAAALPLF